ncbi:MAG: sugar transferase, partial [Flavobacteriales bacterium]|nr:sugar transferase [Flavobacteriales bacterium]
MKRLTDLVSSGIGLLVLFPFLALIYILVRLDSKGPGFYRQIRVGKNNIDFGLWKFRTMRLNADQQGLLTVGGRDPRITRIGYYLRRYKLDELP